MTIEEIVKDYNITSYNIVIGVEYDGKIFISDMPGYWFIVYPYIKSFIRSEIPIEEYGYSNEVLYKAYQHSSREKKLKRILK